MKIKKNIKLKNLKKFGFEEKWFGLYGPGDYIPEYYYRKFYKDNKYYLETNHYFFDVIDGKLRCLTLYKRTNNKKYDKAIPFNRMFRIVRVVLKDLRNLGIIEK